MSNFILGPEITSGQEATIHTVIGRPELLAKHYKEHHFEQPLKVTIMASATSPDPCIAWPLDRITDRYGRTIGIIMPRFTNTVPLCMVYNPHHRVHRTPQFTWEYLLVTGMNLARVVATVHRTGYVIGDVSDNNILVNRTANAYVIDADSFQVTTRYGLVLHCRVGTTPYVPPELQTADLTGTTRSVHHDNFGLAVIIYKLLMEGTHPYAGIYKGIGKTPSIADNIMSGTWVGSRSGIIEQPVTAPPFHKLPLNLRAAFERCFTLGHHAPERRPPAEEWAALLNAAHRTLTTCRSNPYHKYTNEQLFCPWCSEQRRHGYDPFPKPSSTYTQWKEYLCTL